MNYLKLYNSIIDKALNRELPKEVYSEVHHIIPKCINGSDSPANKARLTAREHFICHYLLCKIYPTTTRLLFAFNIMYNVHGNRVKSKAYEKLRNKLCAVLRERMSGPNNPGYGKPSPRRGIPISESTRNKLSQAMSGTKNPRYGKCQSAEGKASIALANSKRVYSEEKRKQMSETMKGPKNHNFGKEINDIEKMNLLLGRSFSTLINYPTFEVDFSKWSEYRKYKNLPHIDSILKNFDSVQSFLDCINKKYGTYYYV